MLSGGSADRKHTYRLASVEFCASGAKLCAQSRRTPFCQKSVSFFDSLKAARRLRISAGGFCRKNADAPCASGVGQSCSFIRRDPPESHRRVSAFRGSAAPGKTHGKALRAEPRNRKSQRILARCAPPETDVSMEQKKSFFLRAAVSSGDSVCRRARFMRARFCLLSGIDFPQSNG